MIESLSPRNACGWEGRRLTTGHSDACTPRPASRPRSPSCAITGEIANVLFFCSPNSSREIGFLSLTEGCVARTSFLLLVSLPKIARLSSKLTSLP